MPEGTPLNNRMKIGRGLASAGSIILFAGALLHLIGGYPQVSAGLLASNLTADLKPALRGVFLMLGWHWIVIALIAAVAAFTRARLGKALALICGFATLVDAVLMAAFLGWFVGTDMILASSLLLLCSGFMLASAKPAVEAVAE
jgi:hypothetical protein